MVIYKLDSKSHLRHLWSLIVLGIILPFSGHYLMIYKLGDYNLEIALIVGSVIFSIFILPLLALHVNHTLYSKGNSFLYDEPRGLMIFDKCGSKTRFREEDIKSITCYKSWPMAQNRTPIFPWDIYSYTIIQLKSGSVFKISSLLVYEFDNKIKLDYIKIRKTFYPWIR